MNKRLPLLMSLFGVILLAASLAYWILQLYQPPQRPIAAAPPATMPDPPIDAAATLFGGQVATASVTNYQLTGIVSAGRDSVAIIVAEGGLPKALKVGRELTPGVTLAEVYPRYVMLSDGGVMKRLDLVPDSKPAAPMGGGGGNQAVAPVALPGQPANVAMPAPAVVQEPPMAPGAVSQQQPQQQPQQQQEYTPPGDVVPHEGPPPTPNITAPNTNTTTNPTNPAPQAPQMPPPTRATGSPAGQNPQTM